MYDENNIFRLCSVHFNLYSLLLFDLLQQRQMLVLLQQGPILPNDRAVRVTIQSNLYPVEQARGYVRERVHDLELFDSVLLRRCGHFRPHELRLLVWQQARHNADISVGNQEGKIELFGQSEHPLMQTGIVFAPDFFDVLVSQSTRLGDRALLDRDYTGHHIYFKQCMKVKLSCQSVIIKFTTSEIANSI